VKDYTRQIKGDRLTKAAMSSKIYSMLKAVAIKNKKYHNFETGLRKYGFYRVLIRLHHGTDQW